MTQTPTESARLDAQMAFLMEADRLKSITRATRIHDGRFENSAEHSWHLALFALVLGEHAPEGISVELVDPRTVLPEDGADLVRALALATTPGAP